MSVGDHADDLHREALNWDDRKAGIASLHEAFWRRLAELNRRHLLQGGDRDIQLDDPRDIVVRLESMCAAVRVLGAAPRMEQAEALGAVVTALALAIARVDDQRAELGDAA